MQICSPCRHLPVHSWPWWGWGGVTTPRLAADRESPCTHVAAAEMNPEQQCLLSSQKKMNLLKGKAANDRINSQILCGYSVHISLCNKSEYFSFFKYILGWQGRAEGDFLLTDFFVVSFPEKITAWATRPICFCASVSKRRCRSDLHGGMPISILPFPHKELDVHPNTHKQRWAVTEPLAKPGFEPTAFRYRVPAILMTTAEHAYCHVK